MKKILLVFYLFGLLFISKAQVPTGYYDTASGLSGAELKNALHNIISSGFQSISYDALWTAFQKTDKKPNGKVWDMYSDIPGGTAPYEYTFITNQCGNYNSENDCYNREHSVPKSWFNNATPMYSDIFHLVPTDGYVNGRRSNYPFGKVNTATWTSKNGSKLGTSNYQGYNGTVFEPIDSFKGDFARIYFYMCVRYMDKMSSWQSTNTNFSNGDLNNWSKKLFLEWHALDPVSQKEKNRNDSIYYRVQHNRNPFVDNPDWVFSIWGENVGMPDYNQYLKNISIYPCPASEYIQLNFTNRLDLQRVEILDLNGKIIKQINTEKIINIEDVKQGFYFIKLYFAEGSTLKQLIILR